MNIRTQAIRGQLQVDFQLLSDDGQRFQFRTIGQSAFDAEKVDAEFKDGVLRITVPKTEASRTKHVEVKC